jgi:ribosomal-protein-alanine N-acetyltransferase
MEPRLATQDLILVACRADVARAVASDRALSSRLCGLKLHDAWPDAELPGVLVSYAKLIEAYPNKIGWGVWLFCRNGVVIGDGGFHGPPKNGRAEIGYSIVPEFRRRGFATQAIRALCAWAFARECSVVAAGCDWGNLASVRVLEKCGFTRLGGNGKLRWELYR